MNHLLNLKRFDYLIASTGYLLIALFILNSILFSSPGTIGFFHDWPIGPYPEMNRLYANGGFYVWDPQLGDKFYFTDWIFRLSLIPFSFLSGEILTKGLLLLAITLSGFGAFCLGKQLKLSPFSSFAAGILFIFSPIMFTRIVAGHIYYLVAYFLSPFILILFLKGKEERKNGINKHFIIAGILASVAVIQIQFLVIIFVVLLIFSLVDFKKIKLCAIGLIVIFSITCLVNLSPIVISYILYDKGSQSAINPVLLLSYHEITSAPDLTNSLRLLGYTTHPYSYSKLGTSQDHLFEEDIKEMANKTNLVENRNFTFVSNNDQSKLPLGWNDPFENCKHIFRCDIISSIPVRSQSKNISGFQISTVSTGSSKWSFINGKEINVKPQEQYTSITHMKLNQYATQSHVAIEGYNETSKKWNQIIQCPTGTNGPLEWHSFVCQVTIPKDVDKIRPILNAGWSSQLGKEAVTLFDAIWIMKLNDTSVIIPSWIFYLDFLLPITGFSALIFRQDKYTLSFAIISLIGLFLLKGPNPPLPGIFNFIFIHGFYIFRELWHIAFLYGFGISFLIAFFLERIVITSFSSSKHKYYSSLHQHQYSIFSSEYSKPFFVPLYNKLKNYYKIILSSFLVSIIAISNGYPLLIGNFGGYLQTYDFPKDYHKLYNNLLTNSTYNTLILPLLAPMRYDGLGVDGLDPLLTYSTSNIFDQLTYSSPFKPTTGLITWLYSVIHRNDTSNLGKILSGLGIKYIILRKDFVSNYPNYVTLGSYKPFTNRWYSPIGPFLDAQKDLIVISNTPHYKIYENTNDAKKFFIPLTIANGLSDYRSLLYISNFTSLSNVAAYPSTYYTKNYMKSDSLKDQNTFVYDFIDLGKYTTSTNARKAWTTNRDWFGYNYLLASRVHVGAFTMAPYATLSFSVSPAMDKVNKPVEVWIRAFTWPKGGTVSINIDENRSLYSLYSPEPGFSLIRVFDGKSNHAYYHFSITNIAGSNYIEGIYINKKDYNYKSAIFDNQNLTNLGIEDINLLQQPATIDKFTKINPTLWNVHINNASKPFVLVFAELFNPSWEAWVYKNGKKVDTIKSDPLYGALNGFQINQAGNLDIVIEYGPQRWFEIGLIISGITLAVCLSYLLYGWLGNKVGKSNKKANATIGNNEL